MEISRMRDLGPKRFGFWGRMLLNFKIGLRIGLPAISLLTLLGGCSSGKNYHTFKTDPGTWEQAAARLCPNIPDYASRLKELNFGELTPREADNSWYSSLFSEVRIAVPDPECETRVKVEPQPAPIPPVIPPPINPPSHDAAEQRDVVESQPDVTSPVQADVPPPQPEAQPEVQDTAPTKVKPDSGHRPRPDAHSGGGADTQTPTPPVIPQ